MGQTNKDANGFSPGNVSLNMPCGHLAGDGPNRTSNAIPTDAPTQSTVNSAPTKSNVNNPGIGVTAPNAGKPIVVSGGAGSTANPVIDVNPVVSGQVPGTSVVFNSRD